MANINMLSVLNKVKFKSTDLFIFSQNPRTGNSSIIVVKVKEQSEINCLTQDQSEGTIFYHSYEGFKYIKSNGSSDILDSLRELDDPQAMALDPEQK